MCTSYLGKITGISVFLLVFSRKLLTGKIVSESSSDFDVSLDLAIDISSKDICKAICSC